MTAAQYEQKIFWNIFDEELKSKGNPFSICYIHNNDIKHYASVNQKKALVNTGLTIDFLYSYSIVKFGIYINNNVDLFNSIYRYKSVIEEKLGFAPQWILSGVKNPNTRRIITTFPIKIGNHENYAEVIRKLIPYVIKYQQVFKNFIPNLFCL